MSKQHKPDPYNGFKDDRERRLALNTRALCYTVAAVAWAVAGSPTDWLKKLQWLAGLWP